MSNPYEAPASGAQQPEEGPFSFAGDAQQTASRIEQMFAAEGYKLESGTPVDAVYGKGSNILRMILGAFIKRYCFKVTVNPTGSGSLVDVQKGMTGMMGGAIGYSQMKKEHARICERVHDLASSTESTG